MTSAFKLFTVAIFVINSVDNTKVYPVILSHRRSTTVSLETYYLYISKPPTNPFPNITGLFTSNSGKEKEEVSFFDSKVMLSTNDVWVKKKLCLRWRIASKMKKELPSVVCQIYQLHLFRAAGFTYQISY